jgi:hypothetical protein
MAKSLESLSAVKEARMLRVVAAIDEAMNRADTRRHPCSPAKYLRANPEATIQEIMRATGCCAESASGAIYHRKIAREG